MLCCLSQRYVYTGLMPGCFLPTQRHFRGSSGEVGPRVQLFARGACEALQGIAADMSG